MLKGPGPGWPSRYSSTLRLGALAGGLGFLLGGAFSLALLAAGASLSRLLDGFRHRKQHAGALFGLVEGAAEFQVALALFA